MAMRTSLVVLVCLCAATHARESCLTRWMERAGIKDSKAQEYENKLAKVGVSKQMLLDTSPIILAFLTKANLLEIQGLQQCVGQKSKSCRSYTPCHFGGECILASARKGYVCKCGQDYNGKFCQTPHPAPVGEFRRLQRTVQALKKELRTVKRPLGYSFRMLGQAVKDSGTIFTIPFIKKRSDTLTRISLVTSFRSYTNVAWQVLIDGQACTSPRNIQTAQHQSDRGNTVTPGTLAGICKATRRGRIGKGRHTISILVKNRHRDDVLTGWNGSSMLEVQEILRP